MAPWIFGAAAATLAAKAATFYVYAACMGAWTVFVPRRVAPGGKRLLLVLPFTVGN